MCAYEDDFRELIISTEKIDCEDMNLPAKKKMTLKKGMFRTALTWISLDLELTM